MIDPINSAEGQLRNFLDAILTGQGLLAFVMFLLLAVFSISVRRMKWILLSLLLYASTLGFQGGNQLSIAPLRQMQFQGRGLTGAALLLLLLAVASTSKGWRRLILPVSAIAFFAFQLIFSARLLFGGLAQRATVGSVLFVLTFFAIVWGVSRSLQRIEDARSLFRAFGTAAALFAAGTALQLLVDPTAMIWKGRLFATTGNPQHAAVLIALSLPTLGFLIVRPGEPKMLRLIWSSTAALLIVFLIWTGSRTGLLMSLTGVGFLFRNKLGRLLVAAAMCGVFVLFAIQLFSDSTAGADRLVSVEDTRSHVWARMFDEFLSNPVFGNIGEEIEVNENSYLAAASRFGIFGLLPLLVALTISARSMLRLHRLRMVFPPEMQMMADVSIASLLAVAIGAVFEGYLLGTLSFAVFAIYLHLTMIGFLTEWVIATTAQFDSIPEYPPDHHATDRGDFRELLAG